MRSGAVGRPAELVVGRWMCGRALAMCLLPCVGGHAMEDLGTWLCAQNVSAAGGGVGFGAGICWVRGVFRFLAESDALGARLCAQAWSVCGCGGWAVRKPRGLAAGRFVPLEAGGRGRSPVAKRL